MHAFDVQVDPQMMRRAWNAWFLDRGRVWRLVPACILIAVPIFMDLQSGSLGNTSIICLTVLGFVTVIYVGAYFAGLRRALAKHESIVEGKARYTLTDSTIEAVSSLGSISLAWSAITEVRCYHGLILLGFRGCVYSTIPESQIPSEALQFLVERARANGAKITAI